MEIITLTLKNNLDSTICPEFTLLLWFNCYHMPSYVYAYALKVKSKNVQNNIISSN